MRRLVPLVLALCFVVPFVPASVGRADDSAAEQAAKEIADARERANAAADAYFSAESRIDQLAVDEQQLLGEVDSLQAEVSALQAQVENVAVNRYTRSGTIGIPLLSGFKSPEEQVQIDALIDVINATSAEDFDRFDSLNRDLVAKKNELAATRQQAEREKANIGALRDSANAEVERLKEVEAQRLQDEAVRSALRAEEAERARRAAALAKQAPPTTAAAAAGAADDIDSSLSGDQSANPGGSSLKPPSSGGQTGAGGVGGNNVYGGVDWVCPTGSASVAFGDTWGAPRSGGRRHEGVDMIGARGTPVLAVVDGFAQAKTNTLGGTTVWFTGADGNKYYYAHLDSYGTLGGVSKGEVIGYMGDTGNAKFSVVHLHFEIHPGGGPAVNPYPTVRARC